MGVLYLEITYDYSPLIPLLLLQDKACEEVDYEVKSSSSSYESSSDEDEETRAAQQRQQAIAEKEKVTRGRLLVGGSVYNVHW